MLTFVGFLTFITKLAAMNTLQQETKTVYFYYPPFIADIVMRWLSMGIYQTILKDDNGHEEIDLIVFGIVQLIITGITIFWVLGRFKKLKQNYAFLQSGFYEEKVSLLSVVFRIFNVVSVTYILAGAIEEQNFYQKFLELRPESSPAIYVIIFLIYAGSMVFLSFSSISVPQEHEGEFVASIPASEPLPLGRWVKKLTKKSDKPSRVEPPFLDKDLFINTFDYQIDHNDLEIIKVEGRLRNEHSRVEAYILESVMFGALAFSGFLSIIASERFNHTLAERNEHKNVYVVKSIEKSEKLNDGRSHTIITDTLVPIFSRQQAYQGKKVYDMLDIKATPNVTNTEMRIFWNEAMSFFKNILIFRFDNAGKNWDRIIQPSNLIMLITMETLFCALFFLSVIASRLRYTKMTEEIDNLARLARNFNDKEEEVHNLVLQGLGDDQVQANLRRRLQSLGMKINQYLERANELLDKARPILVYMSVFRNLGVIMFIFILITSSLFFSKTLAFIFLIFSVVAYVYEYVDIKLRMKVK